MMRPETQNIILNIPDLSLIIKGAMQWDFDDLILASPIIKHFWRQTFFSSFSSK